MEVAGNVDLDVRKDLSMSLTRKAAVSVTFTIKLTLKNRLTAAPGSAKARRLSKRLILKENTNG
jgi:hypothetical protein